MERYGGPVPMIAIRAFDKDGHVVGAWHGPRASVIQVTRPSG
jgi:hypothetical protein